ncbi:MAG: DUF4185 domain-containing protein [Candidatus Marinimicrobia bacterium]|nr:DUF4185 domain-containing protein [Candidatus Neomarinimicrobiota bacterium]
MERTVIFNSKQLIKALSTSLRKIEKYYGKDTVIHDINREMNRSLCSVRLRLLIVASLIIATGCQFDQIDQPSQALPGEVITISVLISDSIDETTNPHRGVLCVLLPQDWTIVSADYSSSVGSGNMELTAAWADSAEACYPALEFESGMAWQALISDTGYTYTGNPSVLIDITIQVGNTEGCFDLAFLATKATPDLICSGWSPMSFPHRIGVPDSCITPQGAYVEPAPDWSDLFDRTSGWTGSDAAYSIPLSGYDYPGGMDHQGSIFVFGDTFIGEVDSNDRRHSFSMIRNTIAYLPTIEPDPDSIEFIWDTDNSGNPTALFKATTPASEPGDWIWPMDGIAVNDSIYIFGLRLHEDGQGVFGFKLVGATLISFVLDSTNSISGYRQIDAPLFYADSIAGTNTVYGQAVMSMTVESGNPNPDGYIYIYGPESGAGQKKLKAARILPEHISDFDQWRFWNGTDWVTDLTTAAALTLGISQEFSLTSLDNGQFLLVYLNGNQVTVRYGDSPVGPFYIYQHIYTCPETFDDPNIFVYNAKAHPHLSTAGQLLISYNVNTFSLADLINSADIYRPRFITLFFDTTSVNLTESTTNIPKDFILHQNYPNPFNPSTRIVYSLNHRSEVKLTIYDLLGREVRSLLSATLQPGEWKITWEGRDNYGREVSAGIYLYQIKVTELPVVNTSFKKRVRQENRKMILLK